MRAFSVSLRTRRLAMEKNRSISVPACSAGGFWKDGAEHGPAADSNSAVTFVRSVESKREENEDGNPAELGSRCAAATTEDASKNTIPATESRTRITPNSKETLV